MGISRAALLAIIVASSFAPAVARAQGIPSAAAAARDGEEIRGDPRVAVIDAVERGAWFSVDVGPNYYLAFDKPDFVQLNPKWNLVGTRIGVRVGYDILNNIAFDLFALGNFNRGVINEKSVLSGQMTGDLAHLAVGGGLRFSFITLERFFAFVRVGGGYAFWFPSELARNKTGSFHTDASLGVEYYTRLRHLSVGLEVDGQALIAPWAFGFQVYPTVKYTF